MFKIVIVGRPNVGKSMLFNTLIGERKAIVERTPGVTRDMIEGYMELENNKGVLLIDTGGINWGGKDFFNKAVIEVVEKSLAEADLVLLVVDAKEGLTTEDLTTAEYLRKTGKKVILEFLQIKKLFLQNLNYRNQELFPYPLFLQLY